MTRRLGCRTSGSGARGCSMRAGERFGPVEGPVASGFSSGAGWAIAAAQRRPSCSSRGGRFQRWRGPATDQPRGPLCSGPGSRAVTRNGSAATTTCGGAAVPPRAGLVARTVMSVNSGQSERQFFNVRSAGKPDLLIPAAKLPGARSTGRGCSNPHFHRPVFPQSSPELTCDFARIIHKSMHRQLSWQVRRLRVSTSQGRKP